MNTQLLMTASSLILVLAGVFALFAPDALLPDDTADLERMYVLIQLLGALYFAFALMNWTAKDSAIGGIHARPVSLANFGHFFVGTLLLAKYQLSSEFNIFILAALIVYAIFAALFYWLVFRHTGIRVK